MGNVMEEGYTFITGAGSGLGRELAILLAKMETPIVLVGRDAEKLQRTQSALSMDKSLIIAIDVSNKQSVDQAFDSANKNFGYPHIVISCAGAGVFANIGSFSQDQVELALNANLLGPILVSQRAFIEMKQLGGTIINVMSTASHIPRIKESVYCAAKFGARGFTESLRLEAKGTPVRVMAVYPGGMKTPFWSDSCGIMPDTTNFMEPCEVAQVIVDNLTKRQSLQVSDLMINRL